MLERDFMDVEIHLRDSQDGYHVHIQLGDGSGFDSPFSAELLPWSSSGDARQDGQRLFDALFAGRALGSWGGCTETLPGAALAGHADA